MATKYSENFLDHVFFPNVYSSIVCDVAAKMSTFELMHCFGLLILCLTKSYRVFKKKFDDPPTCHNIRLPL